jgi:hypothetical protein
MEQIKCYCGHTTYCDCGPLEVSDEAKQRAANYMSLKGALEPKEETIEEAVKRMTEGHDDLDSKHLWIEGFEKGAKWQSERMYSEEELIDFAHFYFREEFNSTIQTSKPTDEILQEWKSKY